MMTSHRLQKPVRLWQLTSDDADVNVTVDEPSDVTFTGPNSFVVADSTRHRLLRFDLERNVCSVVGDHQVWPNCVAVTADDKLLVTDRRTKAVVVYDMQRGDRVAVWQPGDDLLRRPHGLAVTSRGEVIVTDTSRSTVYLLSASDGRLLRQFGCKGDQLQQLRLPFYCAYDADRDEILVSDNINYCVKIFDAKSTSYLRRIGSGNTFGQRQFQCPYGLCVDRQTGNVLVADSDTNRLFEFDGTSGKFLRYALTAASDDCRRPCGVAVGDNCDTLVVTQSADVGSDGHMIAGNVVAYRLHERDVTTDITTDRTWRLRTESAV